MSSYCALFANKLALFLFQSSENVGAFCISEGFDVAKLTDKDWLEIKTKYQAGHKLRDIAIQFGINFTTVSKRAKKDGWTHGDIQQEIAIKANAVSELISVEQKIQQKIQQNQTDIVNREVFELAELKNKAKDVQQSMLELIKLASDQAKQIMIDNPNGLHITSQGESIGFGRNTQFVKDLIPAMNVANAILGIGKEQPSTAIQVNNNTNTDNEHQSLIINIQPIEA